MFSGDVLKLALKKLVAKVEPPATVPLLDMPLAVAITDELTDTVARLPRRRLPAAWS